MHEEAIVRWNLEMVLNCDYEIEEGGNIILIWENIIW